MTNNAKSFSANNIHKTGERCYNVAAKYIKRSVKEMRKKLLCTIALSILTIAAITGCGADESKTETSKTTEATEEKKDETQEASEETTTEAAKEETTQATSEAVTEAAKDDAKKEDTSATDLSNVDFNGTYVESVAGRGVMTVTMEGDSYCVEINWGSSAAESSRWLFHGNFDANGVMTYTDCYKQNITFDEEGNDTTEEQYTGGSGSITYKDGKITWKDDQENVADGCEFVKN